MSKETPMVDEGHPRCCFPRLCANRGEIHHGEAYFTVGSRSAHVKCATENLRRHRNAIMAGLRPYPELVDQFNAEAHRAIYALDVTDTSGSLVFDRSVLTGRRPRFARCAMN